VRRRLTGKNITFRYQGEGELYGHDVKLRPAFVGTSGNRSWIDINHRLPSGIIERFYIYVHNVTELDPQSRRIRLQVWRYEDVNLREFRLVWLQLIVISPGYDAGALYSVCHPT